MSQFMEDLLCGIVGYGFGKYNHQVSEAQAEDLYSPSTTLISSGVRS